jgi:hypothetical protein
MLFLELVLAFGKLFNHLSIECRNIIGLRLVTSPLSVTTSWIDPFGTGIDQVRFQ